MAAESYYTRDAFYQRFIVLKKYGSDLFYVLKALDLKHNRVVVMKFGTDENVAMLENEITHISLLRMKEDPIDRYTDSVVEILDYLTVSRDILKPLIFYNQTKEYLDSDEEEEAKDSTIKIFTMPIYQYAPEIEYAPDFHDATMRGFLFELVYTIAICNMKGVFHGDLHLQNVMKAPVDYVRQYTVNDRKYTIRSSFIPVIIDWSGPNGNRTYKYGRSDFQMLFFDIKSISGILPLDMISTIRRSREYHPNRVVTDSFFDIFLSDDIRTGEKVKYFKPVVIP